MSRRRLKPKSPDQIAVEKRVRRARDFEAVGLQPEAASLPMNDAIEVRHAERTRLDGARRHDAFDALRPGMAGGAYDAARRLEHDMAMRRSEADRGRSLILVDGGTGRGAIDIRLAAGERVERVLSGIGVRDALLLSELIEPKLSGAGWRDTVARVTGETHPHAQGAAVRGACANLAAAYREDKPNRAA